MLKFKKVLSLFVFLTVSLFMMSRTQAQVVVDWDKVFVGTGTEYGADGFMTADGGFVVVGKSTSPGTPTSGCTGAPECSIYRLDSVGNILWQKCHAINYNDKIYDAKLTTDGGIIIAGMKNERDYLFKTDSLGNLEWEAFLGVNNSGSAGTGVKQTADNGYILTGIGKGTFPGSIGMSDMFLAKFDSVGMLQWQFCYGTTNEDEAYDVTLDSDGGYSIVGRSYYAQAQNPGHHGDFDITLIKTDSLGIKLWQKYYGGSNGEEAYEIKKTMDGGNIIVGVTGSSDGQVVGGFAALDFWVIKTDSLGNLEWQKCLGSNGPDRGYSIIIDTDGNYLVGGYIGGSQSQLEIEYFGDTDYWVTKIDTAGSTIWQKSFGGTGEDVITSIIAASDNSFVLLGTTNSRDGDVNSGNYTKEIWAIKITENYNTINGSVYYDFNNNSTLDSSDYGIGYHKLTESTTGNYYFSDGLGDYKIYVVDTGNYSIVTDSINYHNSVPLSQVVNFPGINQTDSLNDFFIQSAGPVNDLCISITPMGNFRSGFNASYMLSYSNLGTTILNPTIIFLPDSNLTYVSSSLPPTTLTSDTIYWTLGPLDPLQTGNIIVTTNVNLGIPIGTIINSGAIVEPIAGDIDPVCNTNYWEILTTGSFDPNDIKVSRSKMYPSEFPNPPYLEYLIRFQNTGNDTAFFVNIRNNISSMLDINTFEVVASSHNAVVEYTTSPRLMNFRFDNILLVDDNTNEPESHGFIRYRIKPVDTLVLGNIIRNQASIFFDYNSPIITNQATTTIVLPVGEAELNSTNTFLKVFPNPAKDEITILLDHLNGETITLDLYSAYGQKISSLADDTIIGEQFKLNQNIAHLAKGIYFIQLKSKNGMWMSRFVKM